MGRARGTQTERAPRSGRASRSSRARRSAVALTVLLALAAVGAGLAAGAAGIGPGGTGDASATWSTDDPTRQDVDPDGVFAQEDVDPDGVMLRAEVDETGTATWRVEYRVRLDTDEREQAFADLEQDVEENPGDYRDRFGERMERTAGTAADATGREMSIENVDVSTERKELPESYGVVTYEFRWTNFAVVDDDRIAMGDALAGYFLEESHRLVLSWPEGYELRSASPEPDSAGETSVTWTGPVDFAGDEPRVVTAAPSGLPITGIAGALGLALVAGALFWRRDRLAEFLGDGADGGAPDTTDARGSRADVDAAPNAGSDSTDAGGAAESGAAVGSGGASEPDAAAESGEPTATVTAAAGGGTTEGDASPSADGEDDGADGPPEELLSNEERVVKLIRENGGRMKQQDVVQALDWTEARTSQVVTGLREEGTLEGFRLGRENVLRLPEEDDEELP